MNLVVWSVFGFMIIAVFAIVSNTGATATANIGARFEEIGCPMPEQSGLWSDPASNGQGVNSTLLQRDGFTYNYPNSGNQTLTLTCTPVHTMNGLDYCFGCPSPPAVGVLIFIGDYISEFFFKASAFFQIIGYILTPINFDIMGFTIADLDGISLMIVIGLYIFAYIPIGIFLYKAISPFAGLG